MIERIGRATWIAALVASVALVLFAYARLPSNIPTHFDINFKPDDYGPKWTLLVLPLVQIALSVALSLTKRLPITWNSMYDPNKPEEAPRIRALTSAIVESATALTGVVFLAIEIAIVRVAGLH